jgi:hypothetical protein
MPEWYREGDVGEPTDLARADWVVRRRSGAMVVRFAEVQGSRMGGTEESRSLTGEFPRLREKGQSSRSARGIHSVRRDSATTEAF